jgi:hypothetical protein
VKWFKFVGIPRTITVKVTKGMGREELGGGGMIEGVGD